MKILITGANGNIGSNLYAKLGKKNHITAIEHGYNNNDNNFIDLDLTNVKNEGDFFLKSDYYDALIFLVGLAYTKGKRKDFS